MVLVDVKERVLHPNDNMTSANKIVVLLFVPLPWFSQRLVLHLLRLEDGNNVSNIQRSEKDHHLLLPMSKIDTNKFIQLSEIRGKLFDTCHPEERYHKRLLQTNNAKNKLQLEICIFPFVDG